jgi:Protein of unknown function (DUF3306)
MSEPENFLARWSRRKRAGADPAQEPAAKEPTVEKKEEPVGEQVSSVQTPREDEPPAFDLSRLPPIESIVAGTDIRPFLAPGVPAELTRAALRRAWTTDPGIRDFIGLSENAWDFTKGGPTGFGPLLPIDDVKKLLAEVFSHREEAEPREPERDSMVVAAVDSNPIDQKSRDVEKKIENTTSLQSSMIDQQVTADGASENDALQNKSQSDEDGRPAPKRSHGSALPE